MMCVDTPKLARCCLCDEHPGRSGAALWPGRRFGWRLFRQARQWLPFGRASFTTTDGHRCRPALRWHHALLLVGLLCAGILGAAYPARMAVAEDAGKPLVDRADGLSAEERADLVARLSDEQVRELLLRELDRASGATRPAGTGTTGTTAAMIGGVGAGIDHIRSTWGPPVARLHSRISHPCQGSSPQSSPRSARRSIFS